MTGLVEPGPTLDALLGGRVRLLQPRRGFRAATDAVLLAAACAAAPGARALDLGCGVGAAALCLAARVPGVELHGLEIQGNYADLAERNAALNRAALTVHRGDVSAPPTEVRGFSFDHAILNPPWFDAADPAAPEAGRAAARGAGPPLAVWLDAALRRLRQGGRLALIDRVGRLPEALAALAGRAGDVAVLPLQARAGRPAERMILTARKDARGPFRLAHPLVLHDGPAHPGDRDHYSREAAAILRDAAPLAF